MTTEGGRGKADASRDVGCNIPRGNMQAGWKYRIGIGIAVMRRVRCWGEGINRSWEKFDARWWRVVVQGRR